MNVFHLPLPGTSAPLKRPCWPLVVFKYPHEFSPPLFCVVSTVQSDL
jgi:hypothetical protein